LLAPTRYCPNPDLGRLGDTQFLDLQIWVDGVPAPPAATIFATGVITGPNTPTGSLAASRRRLSCQRRSKGRSPRGAPNVG
jgi:hypothetical protein